MCVRACVLGVGHFSDASLVTVYMKSFSVFDEIHKIHKGS